MWSHLLVLSSVQCLWLSVSAGAFTLDASRSFNRARVQTMNQSKRTEMFRRLRAATAEPKTELDYGSPFELLVAVVLSAQATDKSVNIATRDLFKVADTPQKILALGKTGLEHHIKRIGLYHTKAKNILATCELLIGHHGGAVPRTREALEQLPGVGRKTANVILNVAFGQPVIAVDTHIFRVSNRTGIAPGRDVISVEEKLLKLVPDEFKLHAHHWLILHGRYVCKARNPDCPSCLIADLCEFGGKSKETAKKKPA
jgi:endonuclease-3